MNGGKTGIFSDLQYIYTYISKNEDATGQIYMKILKLKILYLENHLVYLIKQRF